METIVLTPENCQILTDSSSCLTEGELDNLDVKEIPFDACSKELMKPIKALLDEKEFVLFVGTAPSLSDINDNMKHAVKALDKKDKGLKAEKRVLIINTSCFSGGLGFYVTEMSSFLNEDRKYGEVLAFGQFLSNHIAHFFIEPSEKRWNQLIYVPRTGKINFEGGKFRGNKGVYNYLAADFQEHLYHPEQKVWICHPGKSEAARNLATHIKHCSSDATIDMSHQLMPNSVNSLADNAVACFFLSTDVRPDEPSSDYSDTQRHEIEQKRLIAKHHITEISKFAQAYQNDANPFSEA
jgi:fatty acid-binding protein DegV